MRVKNYITAACKTGPLAMLIFLIGVSCLEEGDLLEFDSLLMFFMIGTFITTIIAIIACFIVFGVFEAINNRFLLRLHAHALFHHFLPLLLFPFGVMLAATLCWNNDPFSVALATSSFLSAVFAWSFYCHAKAQMEQVKFIKTSYPKN